MLVSETHYRVRYADTDQMGYMYYGHYARLYEIGRVEALREAGFRYRDMEAGGVMMPVYEMQCRYRRPARYDELLTVRTRLRALPATRIVFDFEVFDEAVALLNTGQVTLVFVRTDNQRPIPAPAALLDCLRAYF